ncbi:MAG: hypothetical protein R3279_11490, partial [Putridiphycobacter sp.]|nr:hypothetical protein [Putridiphycobacter sp.]
MHAAELDDSYTTLNDSIEKYLLSQPDKSLIYAKQLLTKAIQEDNDNQIAKGLASVSRSYFLLKDYENAQLEAKNHLRHVKNLDDIELLIGSLLLNSEVEIMLTNIDLSHELLLDALQIADSLNSDLYRETILSKLSGFYDLSGQLEKAVEMRKQSLYILENRSIDSNYTAVTKFQTVVYSYAVLAASFLKIDQIDSAKSYNEKVKLLAEEKDTCKLIYYYNIKGDILLKEGQYEKAEAAYQKSLYYCPPDYPLFDLNMAFRFGKVAYGLRNYERTIEILDNGLENYTVSEAEEAYMDEYYKLLADSY